MGREKPLFDLLTYLGFERDDALVTPKEIVGWVWQLSNTYFEALVYHTTHREAYPYILSAGHNTWHYFTVEEVYQTVKEGFYK